MKGYLSHTFQVSLLERKPLKYIDSRFIECRNIDVFCTKRGNQLFWFYRQYIEMVELEHEAEIELEKGGGVGGEKRG